MDKTAKLELLLWFWYKGHDMTHYEEFNSDAGTLKMVNHIEAYRIIDVFLVNVLELSKPLQTILPPEFKLVQ